MPTARTTARAICASAARSCRGPFTIRARGAGFELVESGVTVEVDHHGSEPTLFKDCAPVVADGHWDHDTFDSDQILIKHGATYQPPSNAKASCPKDPFGK